MVFSQYKAAFVHVPKTAGVSIYRTMCEGKMRHEHMTAAQLRVRLGDLWSEYTVFSVVRNPWERTVSGFHYLQQYKPHVMPVANFEEWVDYIQVNWDVVKQGAPAADPIYPPQVHWNCIDGKVATHILRYESLSADWAALAIKIGAPATLSYCNSSVHDEWIKYYNSRTIRVVGEVYAEDVAMFNYHMPKRTIMI